MRKLFLYIYVISLFAGCASKNPDEPIDRAIKMCGLGINSESKLYYKTAFELSDKSGGLTFEENMKENLDTQVMSLMKSKSFQDKADAKDILDEIKQNRHCVIAYSKMFLPKSRAERVSMCMDDLQDRLKGKNKRSWSGEVKNWFVVEEHPAYTNKSPIVTLFVDHGGRKSYHLLVQCNFNDNYEYESLQILKK